MRAAIVFVLILCLLTAPVLAAGIQDQPLLYDGAELEDICKTLDWTLSDEQRQAYKVYQLKRQDVFTALDSGLGLEALISEEYTWVIPGYDRMKTVLAKTDGVWGFSGSSGLSSGHSGAADDTVDYGLVERGLAVIPDARLQCFYATVYRSYFVWFRGQEKQGLMVFSARPDFTLLENGRLYSPEEVGQTLLSSGNFTEPVEARRGNPLWMLLPAGAAAAAALWLLKKRKG